MINSDIQMLLQNVVKKYIKYNFYVFVITLGKYYTIIYPFFIISLRLTHNWYPSIFTNFCHNYILNYNIIQYLIRASAFYVFFYSINVFIAFTVYIISIYYSNKIKNE